MYPLQIDIDFLEILKIILNNNVCKTNLIYLNRILF